jgi:hypothetical protein
MIIPANILRWMDPAARAQYDKNDTTEIVEQRNFALECKNRGWRTVWHATHKRSTANRGCPDFIVGVRGETFWIEFKRSGEDLRPDQAAFKKELAQNGIIMYVVYNAAQAVEVIESHNRP